MQEHHRWSLAYYFETNSHASALDEPHSISRLRSHYGEPDGCESSDE